MRGRAARLCALALLAFAACGEGSAPMAQEESAPAPEDFVSEGPHDVVVIELGELGSIRIELLPELAPETVANFRRLTDQGFYDGTSFHRVIPGFMVQGGDPLTKNIDPRDDGKGNPGYNIQDEHSEYPHVRGTVSMANRGNRNTGGSQFFIVHETSFHLDRKYTVFGRVIEGMDGVDAITRLEIDKYGRYGPRNRPYPVDARVSSIRIEPAGAVPAQAAEIAAESPAPPS